MIINNNCVMNQTSCHSCFVKVYKVIVLSKIVNTLNYGYGKENIDCPL